MSFNIAVALLIIATVYYAWFILRSRFGLKRLGLGKDVPPTTPSVSVVIAARNEESTIQHCVQTILNQHYPVRQFEVIVVDDHSSDATGDVVRTIAAKHKNVRIISLQEDKNAQSGGKPAAIAAGVEAARGNIILTTDADCSAPREWIATITRYFQPEVAFVAGPVQIDSQHSLLTSIDHLELLGLITVGAGLIGAGRPIICNGANLAYRKSAFLAARGFGDDRTWCDDETIMHRIHQRHLGNVVFVAEPGAMVMTPPSSSLRSFWKQRLRWSSKGGHYDDTSILVSLVLLYFYFLFVLSTAIAGVFNTTILMWVVASLIVKAIVDYFTLSAGARLFRDRIPIAAFLIAEVFHVPYIVITAALGQFVSFRWKGRRINA